MKHCSSCGCDNLDNAKFCIHCGASLAAGAERPAPPSQPKPSPYASLPYQPGAANGDGEKHSALKGAALILSFILLSVAFFGYCISSMPSKSPVPSRPALEYTAMPSFSPHSAPTPRPSSSKKPSWDFEIVDIQMEPSASGDKTYVFGELELHSSSAISNGSVTVELYDRSDRLLQTCSSEVLVFGSEIKFRILCDLSPGQMQSVSYYNVILRLADGI